MQKPDLTTIRISNEIRDQLKDLGKKGETYNDIIGKLLKTARKAERNE